MKKLKWITVSTYVEEETGLILTRQEANKNYIIKEKVIRRQKTKYDTRHKKVVGNYNYDGITEITNICTRTGKQLSIFTD